MLILDYDELHARLLATCALQAQIADDWTWDEKTLVQWDASKTKLESAKQALDGAEAADALALGALEKASQGAVCQ